MVAEGVDQITRYVDSQTTRLEDVSQMLHIRWPDPILGHALTGLDQTAWTRIVPRSSESPAAIVLTEASGMVATIRWVLSTSPANRAAGWAEWIRCSDSTQVWSLWSCVSST